MVCKKINSELTTYCVGGKHSKIEINIYSCPTIFNEYHNALSP